MSTRLSRRNVAGWSVHRAEASSDAVHEALVAWFTSPFWLQSSHLAPALTAGSDVDRARASAHLGECAISRFVSASATGAAAGHASAGPDLALSWVDRHLLGPYGSLERSHYAAVSAALQADRPDAVRVLLHSGERVDASLAAFMTWLLSESTLTGFGPHVTDGIGVQLSRWEPARSGCALVSLAACLPTLEGMALRSVAASGRQGAVPMAIYPLVATLLPEASPYLSPIVDDMTRALVDDEHSAGGLVALTPLERTRIRTERWVARSGRHIAADGVAFGARQVRRTKQVVRGTPLQGLMIRVGLDSHSSRAALRRLALAYGANPLVTRRTAHHLAQAGRVVAVRGPS